MASTDSHLEHSKPDERNGLAGGMPRKINVLMMGAGSFFTNSVLRDVILIPDNQGGELRLCDIDAVRLNLQAKLMQKVIDAVGQSGRWKIVASTDRRELMPGIDYVINSIEVSGTECFRFDNDIPLEFGISQNIGDTMGPGGLMKGMRTIPVYLGILRDMRELAPQAVMLNYTNPMSMLILAGQRAVPEVPQIGLCHSVQGTSRMLAKYAEVPYESVQWKCAGINHLAWFTEFNGPDGTSLYPKLMAMARDRDSEFSKAEPVRSDMMLHFGAFITESSGHLSEYLPYYRKRKDLLEKYTDTGYRGEESFYANNWPTWRKTADENRDKMLSGEKELDLKRSFEYGAWIIESIEKNAPIVVHGNMAPNAGCISNLPSDGCIEVACLINHNGFQPIKFGRLPQQMAAVCDSNMRFFDLAADAAVQQSKQYAEWALMMDPLTAAVCSPAEIRELTKRLFQAEAEYLVNFN
jgi:alpha-galactosidase